MADKNVNILLTASDQTRQAFASAQKGVKDLGRDAERVGSQIKSALGSLGLAVGGGLAVRNIAAMADEFANMQARLKLVSRDTNEFTAANADLTRIAQAAKVPLSETATLYTRIAASVKDLGVSQRDIASTTEAVSLALRISGASTAEASSAMLQFSQAVASGVLRGEEFNAISEVAPRLLQALAASLKVPVGELRAMAKEGRLTREILIDGLLAQLPQLQREAESLPQTIGAAFTDLNNKLLLTVGEFDKLTNATGGFSKAINAIGTTAIEALTVAAANVAFVFNGIGREIGGIAAQLGALARGDFKAFSEIGRMMKEDARIARQELDEFERRILGTGKVAAQIAKDSGRAPAARPPILPAASDGKTGKATKPQGPIDIFDNGSFITRDKGVSDFIRNQQSAINELNGEMAQDGVRAAQEYQSAMDALLADTTLAKTNKLQANIDLLNGAFFGGAIGIEQYDEAIEKLTSGAAQNLEKTKSITEELGDAFVDTFKSAGNSIRNVGDLLDTLKSKLASVLANKASEYASNWIADTFFTASANGNVFSNAPALSAYSGSVVSSPTLFPFANGIGLMGEAGAEAILPLKRGRDGRLGVSMDGGGGYIDNRVYNIDARGAQPGVGAEIRRAIAEAEDRAVDRSVGQVQNLNQRGQLRLT